MISPGFKRELAARLKGLRSPVDVRDAFVLAGVASVCYGVHMIYAPAAWIVGGIVALYLGLR